MSGTSLDGVDAALLRTDGQHQVMPGPALTLPYPALVRQQLRAVLADPFNPGLRQAADAVLVDWHLQAVLALCTQANLPLAQVDVVGFHGQTIYHRPADGITVQLGDGAALAARLGRPVVGQFRLADVAAGGQGAPLVPVYHQAIAAQTGAALPVAVVNIGGVANVTFINAAAELLAFDTGPGNALLDDWLLTHTGSPQDTGGQLAAQGAVHVGALDALLAATYFNQPPPKSLDRLTFHHPWQQVQQTYPLSAADGAATLTAFTAHSIAAAARWCSPPIKTWVLCGGGRHNPTLVNLLQQALGATTTILPIEAWGFAGDALEAQAFGYLAARHLQQLPLSYPGTTGVKQPCQGGVLYLPPGIGVGL